MTRTEGVSALLFDLDDTLLRNSMDEFLPAYFRALTESVAHVIPPERLISELQKATAAMDANDGSGPTNEETFAKTFYPAIGLPEDEVAPLFERFYREEFPKLRRLTTRRPAARALMEWTRERGLQVTIATNPLFPRIAIEQRLAWAGVPVTDFAYDLVTTYENMHATKSHPMYYQEILDRLGRRSEECIMVGDHWSWDIAPAASLGIHTFWISNGADQPPEPGIDIVGHGSLSDLWTLVQENESLWQST